MKQQKLTRKTKGQTSLGSDTFISADTFISPESSNVEGGSYDPLTLQAVIAFKDKKADGPTVYYSYDGMLKEDWEGLKTAKSKGTFMSQVIKRKYKGAIIG